MPRAILTCLLLVPALASAVPVGPSVQAGTVRASSEGSDSAVVTVRLSATVVGTTTLAVRGGAGTSLVAGHRGTGFIALGDVDSEGRRPQTGHAIERADDQGAFYIATLDAFTRYTGGVHGELSVTSSGPTSSDVDFRFACGHLPDSTFASARSGAADGTLALDGTAAACDGAGQDGRIPLQLVLHVPDNAQPGSVRANYVLTASPELM